MKRQKSVFIIALIALAILLGLVGCGRSESAGVTVTQSTEHESSETDSNIDDKTHVSESQKTTRLPVCSDTEKHIEETTKVRYKKECFDKTAFLGNSRLVAIKDYGLACNVFPVVGLDVNTAFSKHVDNSDVVVLDELDGKSFDKVILMFGENECGWPNEDYFIRKYAKVIETVKEKAPETEIYLHAMLPVSAEISEKNEWNCNNERISDLNGRIRLLAEDECVHYIEQPQCLKDHNGNLIDEASNDGVHLNRKYCEIWMQYLDEYLK